MRIKNHVPINGFAHSVPSKTEAWSNSEMAYFRLEHSRWENRITFSDIHCFRNFSTGTTLKVEFHLLANRISKKLFVDGKQPDASLCVKCHPSLHPQPVEGEEGGGGRALIHQPAPPVLIRSDFTSKHTGCKKGPFI